MEQFTVLPKRIFYRTTSCSLDAQGRIIIPKHWRDNADDEHTLYMLAPGFENSIDFYPEEQFRVLQEQAARSPNQKNAQTYLTIWSSHCQPVTLDKQGRFTPDPELLRYAGITKQITCVGATTHGRLFDKDHWEQIQTGLITPDVPLTLEQETALTPEQRLKYNIAKALNYIGSI